MWNTLNQMTGKEQNRWDIKTIIDEDGTYITDLREMRNKFIDHYIKPNKPRSRGIPSAQTQTMFLKPAEFKPPDLWNLTATSNACKLNY